MDKTALLASDILLGVSGGNNTLRLESCMIRVRVEVQDDGQIDIPCLRQLPSVSGYVKQGARHQIIVGPGKAAKMVDAMHSLIADGGGRVGASDIKRTKPEAKAEYKAPTSDALHKLTNVFIPLVLVLIASGLITGIVNILKRPDIVRDFTTHYPNILGLIGIFGSAVFAIMNILVGVSTAKVFGGSLAMGGVMAGIFSSPQLTQITLFDEALQPGRSGMITILLVVALVCWIECKFRTLLPESLELILNPLLTAIVTGIIAIVALQLLGGWISESIAHGASQVIDHDGFLVGAIPIGTFLPLVLTGLRQRLVPVHVELAQTRGYDALFPILTMVDVGQIGAAIAVLTKTRNAWLKKVVKGALPVELLGIGKPLIFGVILPLGKLFAGACLGDAVGGALIDYWRVTTVITFGISGLSLAPTIVAGKVIFYLLDYLVTVIAGFLFTQLLGFTDLEE